MFERVKATGCRACAGYILGLPERPVQSVTVRDSVFDFVPDSVPLIPAMAEHVPAVHNQGIIAQFIDELVVENVDMNHIQGEMVQKL